LTNKNSYKALSSIHFNTFVKQCLYSHMKLI
jgi:hypothetical protein